MPTYDYKCDACGHQWELFHSMSAKPKRKCPDCGKLKAKRMISAGAGVIFKGGGFYQTDYRSDSYKKDAAADKKSQETKSESSSKSDSSSSKSDSSSSKSDSKPSKSE
jgi:putative FmdB family regulatory protein